MNYRMIEMPKQILVLRTETPAFNHNSIDNREHRDRFFILGKRRWNRLVQILVDERALLPEVAVSDAESCRHLSQYR